MPDTAQNLSNSELAILSLIAEGPQHGYEIAYDGLTIWTG